MGVDERPEAKKEFPEKSAAERRKETRKQLAETRRAKAVAEVKLSHKLIEDIEKLRKAGGVFSIQQRILAHQKTISVFARELDNLGKVNIQKLSPEETGYALDLVETYKSIREDIRMTIGLNGDDFNKLFPLRHVHFEMRTQLMAILASVMEQETQMASYLLRLG